VVTVTVVTVCWSRRASAVRLFTRGAAVPVNLVEIRGIHGDGIGGNPPVDPLGFELKT
jgi:hypothetical protein